jgi:hypothetical protein
VYVEVTGPTVLEVAVAFPALLVAVTLQVIFAPFCVIVNTKVFAVALAEMATAFALHWYANDDGLLLHVPLVVVNVLPTVVLPETTGATVFTGGGVTFDKAQLLFAYTSKAAVVVLYRNIPLAGGVGLWAVVPTETVIAPVELQVIF